MKSMLALVTLGLGEIVGSILIGQIIDRFGKRVTSYFCLTFIGVAIVLVFSYLATETYGPLLFAMTFIWGL